MRGVDDPTLAQQQRCEPLVQLLEGDRLIGRIDMKADRKAGELTVRKLWLEPGVRASAGRLERLEAELARLSRFTGVEDVRYLDGWRDG